MNPFFKNVTIVAIVVLIIALTIVGVVIANDNSEIKFPPRIDSCPDYWVHASYLKDPNNNSNISSDEIDVNKLNDECINIKHLGTCNPQDSIMDFTVAPYSNSGEKGPSSGMCAKYKWAKQCNITWDGISNRDDLCNE